MLKGINQILKKAATRGWVMEPEAKQILRLSDIAVPNFRWVKSLDEAESEAKTIGYPLAAKVVSPEIVHKSDVGGVAVGIVDWPALQQVFTRMGTLAGFDGLLIEEMATGVELIAGAKNDHQFGPVILLGLGGVGVEIYQDVTIRMAPLTETDVRSMVTKLTAHKLLEGYRGSKPVNLDSLSTLLVNFSHLALALAEEDLLDSIDLNPVFCSASSCVAADARIMLPASFMKTK